MRRCEDEKMWRWEDVLQTPTIGRTLRSDALGNYGVKQSFELQCRETMDIGRKHLGAGFEAGFEGLKPMEIGAKQHDKEGPLFLVLKT